MGATDHNDRSQDAPQLLGATAFKPPERHGFDIVKYIIYDKEKGEIFTRTPKSWFLITLFYIVYYTCLAAFWYGMLQLFFMTLPLEKPKYLLEENIIGNNPGVGMRPRQADATIDSSMLYIQARFLEGDERPSKDFESNTNVDWAERYREYLQSYENTTDVRECSGNEYNEEGEQACRFNPSILGDCQEYPYGYFAPDKDGQASPCLLLKVNRIYGWKPEPYDVKFLDADSQPDDPIPESIKELITADNQNIYVNCEGENAADREALDGNVDYFPANRNIPFSYFPYTQAHRNYQNPLVAVKLNNLPIGQLVHIECKLWAKGLLHNRKDKQGGIRFEVLIDEDPSKRDNTEL